MFYNLEKSGRALQKHFRAHTKTSSRSGGLGSSFGMFKYHNFQLTWLHENCIFNEIDPKKHLPLE
jgi:hypothetical protein